MREQEQNHTPYWQIDLAIGEGSFHGEEHTIRLAVHTEEEQKFAGDELVRIAHKPGEHPRRIYFHAKPYILVPEITLTIGLDPRPQEGRIGEVLTSEWEGMRHQIVGEAQAWHYPSDRTLVLWEAYLFNHYRQGDPREDPGLITVWTGLERLLLEKLPGTRRIVTPSWEDIYERPVWQEFLRSRGYQPLSSKAFAKGVAAV